MELCFANNGSLSSSETYCAISAIRHLDWTDFKRDEIQDLHADVIMGSDIVYFMDILPGLAKLLRNLLEINMHRGTKAYISCTQRREQSIDTFLKCIKNEGLHYEVLLRRVFSPSDCVMITHEPLHSITIYKISLES